MSKPDNAFQVKAPMPLTVKSLRAYLQDMEALWSDEDEMVYGNFEDQEFFAYEDGIGEAEIDFHGGFGFVVQISEALHAAADEHRQRQADIDACDAGFFD